MVAGLAKSRSTRGRGWPRTFLFCAGTALALLHLAAASAHAVVQYGDWLRLNGLLENYSAVNTYSFSDFVLTMERNTFQFETEAILLRKMGLLRELKFNAMLRPWYDPVYHLNTKRFGVAANDRSVGRVDSVVGPVEVSFPVNPNTPRGKEPIYNDRNRTDLEWSYGSYREVLRELYFEVATNPLGTSFGNTLFVRLGKQQVAWGKTDFFRLADIINPIDYQRHAFLEFYNEIRIPQWILHMVYDFGSFGPFSGLSLEGDWNFDRPLPSHIGQRGTPYAHPFGDETGAFKVLYDEGIPGGTPPVPPHVLGLRESIEPEYTLGNTQYGGRLQGVWRGVTWSIDYWHGYQDLPAFRLIPSNASTGNNDLVFNDQNAQLLFGEKGGKIPLYDMRFFKKETLGGSFDWAEDAYTQSVWRAEVGFAFNEHINDTSDLEDAIQTSNVLRYVIGWDRPTFIKPINPTRTFLLSAQAFFTHILEHHGPVRGPGTIQDPLQVVLTFLVLGFYDNDRFLPVFFSGYAFDADAILLGGWLQYLFTDTIDATLGANSIWGRRRVFDTGAGGGDPTALPPTGLIQSQAELPWGFAKEGFGAWRKIDDIWLRIRYRF